MLITKSATMYLRPLSAAASSFSIGICEYFVCFVAGTTLSNPYNRGHGPALSACLLTAPLSPLYRACRFLLFQELFWKTRILRTEKNLSASQVPNMKGRAHCSSLCKASKQQKNKYRSRHRQISVIIAPLFVLLYLLFFGGRKLAFDVVHLADLFGRLAFHRVRDGLRRDVEQRLDI